MSIIKPNLIGIGGHKCGSTWLYSILSSSQDIFMTNPKEPGYFLDKPQISKKDYYKLYSGSDKYRYKGEFTSYYLYNDASLMKMNTELDSFKVVAVVREPITRALSQIKHGIRNNTLKKGNEKISLCLLKEYIQKYPIIIERSLYYKKLLQFQNTVGADNLLVINYAEIGTVSCIKKLEAFLNLQLPEALNLVDKKIGTGIVPKYKSIEKLRRNIYLTLRMVPFVVPLVRKSGLSELYRKLNKGSDLMFDTDSNDYLNALFFDDWDSVTSHFLEDD